MENNYENMRFLLIPSEIVETINFDEVKETSIESLRYSALRDKTFVKYEIDPETGLGRPSIYSEKYQEYIYEEMLNVLSGDEWIDQELLK